MCKKIIFFWSIVAMLIVAGGAVSALQKAALPWSDGFESGDFKTGGWSVHKEDVIVSDKAKRTGKYGAKIAKTAWIEKAVSTEGFADIQVKYNRQTAGFGSGEKLFVEWHDGKRWSTLEMTRVAGFKDGRQKKACGPGADNNANFKVRFRTNADKANEYAYIDDVEINGTAKK